VLFGEKDEDGNIDLSQEPSIEPEK